MAENLNFFKTEIDLEAYLINQFGYQKSKYYTRKHPRLEKINNGNKTDVITIFRDKNTGFLKFYSWYSQDKARSIVDFLIEERNLESDPKGITKVFQELKENYGSNTIIINQNKTIESLNQTEQKKNFLENQLTVFSDSSFLKSRGISENMIAEMEKRNILFSSIYYNQNTKEFSYNTAVKLAGLNNVTFSLRNEIKQGDKTTPFKGIAFAKKDAIFTMYIHKNEIGTDVNTKIGKTEQSLDKVILAESYIDAVSYYQMNKVNLINENVLLISTEGNPSKEQIKTLTAIKKEPKDYLLAFDNDFAGEKYTFSLMTQKEFYNQYNNDTNMLSFIKTSEIKNFENSDNNFNITGSSEEVTSENMAKEIHSFYKKINKDLKDEGLEPVKLTCYNMEKKINLVEFKLEVPKGSQSELNELISKNYKSLSIVKAINNDFNEDLKLETKEVVTSKKMEI
jgi:hypothetical protein